MKVIFLDFDGVLNSMQSHMFWDKKKYQSNWEEGMYQGWEGSIKEYIACDFCPIAFNNVEELMNRISDLKVVISSSWRVGETVESLKKILVPGKKLSSAIIDVTPRFHKTKRGHEIQDWLDNHPEVTNYVIIDDDNDMLKSQKKHFVRTNVMHGFQYKDLLKAIKILES